MLSAQATTRLFTLISEGGEIMSNMRKWCMLGCFGLICVVLVSIFVRFTTVQIAVKRLHLNNGIIQAVLYDNDDLLSLAKANGADSNKNGGKKIDWVKQYPFKEEKITDNARQMAGEEDFGLLDKIIKLNTKVNTKKDAVEKKISNWTNRNLLGYQKMVELSNQYKGKIGWDIMVRKEYNGVVEIEDGQLAAYCDKEDMSEKINNVVELADFCKVNGAEFVYVSAPSKIDRHDKKYAALDFSNANADSFLTGLKENGVRYVDIRDNIDAEGFTTRKLFFKTDHHWLAETGFWAAGITAKYLEANDIVSCDPTLLDSNRWKTEVHHKVHLGSRGKKLTLARAVPDDITLYYPNFYTHYHLEIPNLELEKDGDFSVIYDMSRLDIKNDEDYYKWDAYWLYLYGDRPYIKLENTASQNNKKLLIVKNSFAEVFSPFISQEFRYTDVLDLRHFDGSLKSFIEQTKPDVVILLYHIESLNGNIDYSKHNSLWDFR